MMKHHLVPFLGLLILAACGGSGSNPIARGGGTGTPGGPVVPVVPTGPIPATLASDVSGLIYDPAAQTLTVQGATLDNVPFDATYTRNAALDRPGYEAYTQQDDPLDRHFTAFVAQTRNEGTVRAGTVLSGGVRNTVNGGGFYERDGAYSPATGLVSYAGSYVGLTNFNGDGGDLLAVPGGTAPELTPSQAAEVTGDIFLNADFADNAVEGNIFNREFSDTGVALPSLVLLQASITADGTFFGDVQHENDNTTDAGDFGGIFGGTNSSGVGGNVTLTGVTAPDAPGELEFGVFVLDQCGQAVDAAICSGVNP